MKFQLHNDEGIIFPPIRPAYEEGELLFERFRTLTPRDAKDSIIGEGGTGLIHLVRDELMDRIVALKLPHENILRDPSARFDVIRETRQAMELTHPHIVRIHDFHEGRGGWGISMQYVRGKNLDEVRHEGRTGPRRTIVPYSPERIESWIVQLCDALLYAHEDARMVHRDIKPKNLMLERRDEDGYEKLLLTDFGITQKLRLHTIMLSRVQPGANEKSTMGTLPYMPWEQIQGAPASTLDDIYAVGATIYELLTGRPPFYEGAYEQIRTQVEKVVPPTMTKRLQDFDLAIHSIPPDWERTVAACLEKRPENRPQSMRDVLAGLGLGAISPPTPPSRTPEISGAALSELQDTLSRKETEVTSVRSELDEKLKELSSLQGTYQGALARVAELERMMEESRSAMGNAEGENLKLINDLQTRLSEHESGLQEALRERDESRQRITLLDQELQSAHQQRSTLEANFNAAQKAASEATQDAETRVREIESAANQRVEAAENIAANATQAAEQEVRGKSARSLAQAIATAEAAKLHIARLTEENQRQAAALERQIREANEAPANQPPTAGGV